MVLSGCLESPPSFPGGVVTSTQSLNLWRHLLNLVLPISTVGVLVIPPVLAIAPSSPSYAQQQE